MKKNTRFLILVLSLAALVFSAVPTEVLAVGPDVYEELEEDSAEVLEMSDDAYEEPVTQVGEESSSEEQREVSEKIDDGVPGEIPDRIEDETSEDVEDETFEDVEEALKVEEGASAEIKETEEEEFVEAEEIAEDNAYDEITGEKEAVDVLNSAAGLVVWLASHPDAKVTKNIRNDSILDRWDVTISYDSYANKILFRCDDEDNGEYDRSIYHYSFDYYVSDGSYSDFKYDCYGTIYTANPWTPQTLTKSDRIMLFDESGNLIDYNAVESDYAKKILGYWEETLGLGDFSLSDVGFAMWSPGSGGGSSGATAIDYGDLKKLVEALQKNNNVIKRIVPVGDSDTYQSTITYKDDESIDNNDKLVFECMTTEPVSGIGSDVFQITYDLKRKKAPDKIYYIRYQWTGDSTFSVDIDAARLTASQYDNYKIMWRFSWDIGSKYEADWRPAMEEWDAMLHSYDASIGSVGFTEYEESLHRDSSISMDDVKVSFKELTYTGSEQVAEATLILETAGTSYTLKKNEDYEVDEAELKGTNAGDYEVTFTGKGSFTGTKKARFTIAPAALSGEDVIVIVYPTGYIYTGSENKPVVTVKFGGVPVEGNVTYANNTEAGMATATFTTTNTNFTKATRIITRTFEIKAKYITFGGEIADIPAVTYTGAAITPTPTVTDSVLGNRVLTEGRDFTYSYANNVNAGTATVTITGKGSYKMTLSKTFTIKRASLTGATITLNSRNYDGRAAAPTFKSGMTANKAVLKSTDIEIEADANANAGSRTAKVRAKSANFTGSTSARYTINKAASNFSVKQTKLTVTGTDKGTITLQNRKSAVSKITFSPKTSAIASYSIENNTVTVKGKKAGKFTLVVTDPETANYKASKPKSILITVSKPTKPAIQNPVTSSRAVTAKWRRVANATGYYVQIATNTGFTKGVKNKVITKNTTITNKFTGLKKGTTYYVRVYSYVGSYTAANRSAVSATRRITCK